MSVFKTTACDSENKGVVKSYVTFYTGYSV